MAELILPGAVDLHTHLREPSTNTSETIASGTRAAMLGGFAVVADMPNNPGMPVWDEERLDAKIDIAERTAYIPTAFYAGSQPEADNVGEIARLAPKAIGLKLYGDPTTGNSNSYEARDFADIVGEWHRVAPDKPIMFHTGEHNLTDMIDLVTTRHEHPLHICHVNHPHQVLTINAYKELGAPITCGVCPHHLLKTSYDVHTQGVFAEMKPPLAEQEHAARLTQQLEAGEIDVIETDFAPHSLEAKYEAEHSGGHCYGVPGIEHVLPLLMYQVKKGRLTMERLVDAISTKPAEILGINLAKDTTVRWVDTDRAYRIGEDDVASACGWTPYLGMLAIGRISEQYINGQPVSETSRRPQLVTRNSTV